MTRRSFLNRVSRWTKKFYCLESDRASRSDRRRAAGRGKVGMYLSERLELRNRGRSGNVRETKRSKLEGRARCTGDRKETESGEKDGAVAGCGGQKTGVACWRGNIGESLLLDFATPEKRTKYRRAVIAVSNWTPRHAIRSLPERASGK